MALGQRAQLALAVPSMALFSVQKIGERRRFLLAAASPAHNFPPSGAALISPRDKSLASAKSERSMTGTGAGLPKKVNGVTVAWDNKLCLVFGV